MTDQEWKKEYQKWYNENTHLPNLQPVDKLANTFIQRKKQFETQQPNSQMMSSNIEGRITSLEQKLDKLMDHLGVK